MNHSDEVRDFLVSRRAAISPAEVGIVDHGEDRRVPGLRREEVAALAGMSIDYYKRLERGNLRGASEAVLEALDEALQLDEAECAHLANLARWANQTIRSRSQPVQHALMNTEVARLLSQVTVPAIVRNGLLDILGANDLGRAVFSEVYGHQVAGANAARSMFLNPRARSFWVDWEAMARLTAAILRSRVGRHPDDPALLGLVAELSASSEAFCRVWARHEVGFDRTGRLRIRHPLAGEMEFDFQSLEVATEAGRLTISTFSAEPDSRSRAALSELTSVRVSPRESDQPGARRGVQARSGGHY